MSHRIAAFALMTPDVERLAAFYRGALGFQRHGHRLTLGDERVRLLPAPPGAQPMPPHGSAADLWFQHLAIVTTDIAAASVRARAGGAVAISRDGPETLPKRSGGVIAWKFRDPDGHPLELLQFPPDAVPARWRGGRALTLGIDHSAISVRDVAASVAYYRDCHGFAVSAWARNYGPEQIRLDDVPDANVDVVAMRPRNESSPHLELLGYHPPGRATRFSLIDVAATRTVLAGGADATAGLMRDPDGHVVAVEHYPSG